MARPWEPYSGNKIHFTLLLYKWVEGIFITQEVLDK